MNTRTRTPLALRQEKAKSWYKVTCPAWGDITEYVYAYGENNIRGTFYTDRESLVIERLDVTYAAGRKLMDAEYEAWVKRPATIAAARVAVPAHPQYDEAVAWLTAYTGDFAFLLDLKSRIGRRFSDRQIEAILKCKANDDRRATERAERATAAASKGATTDGWYKVGDVIYKVQRAVHGSGNLYAKRLDPNGGWEYAPGVVRTLTDDNRLTLEDAKAFGQLYGRCAVCGTTLTDETSIANGIGPVCAGRLA